MDQVLQPIKVQLGEGVVAVIETHVPATSGEQEVLSLHRTFDGVADSIRSISERVMASLEGIALGRASIELGFDLTLEQGQLMAFLVKGSGTASIRVSLTWEPGVTQPLE